MHLGCSYLRLLLTWRNAFLVRSLLFWCSMEVDTASGIKEESSLHRLEELVSEVNSLKYRQASYIMPMATSFDVRSAPDILVKPTE